MGNIYSVTTEGTEAVSAAETLLQLRGATTVRPVILGFTVAFDGTSATATPVQVRLLRQTTDGTATAASEVKLSNPDGGAAAVTAFHSFTAEPTAGDVLYHTFVHPQGLPLEVWFPEFARPVMGMAATSRIGLEVTPGAAVNALATLLWEE